jgi:LysR family hca operon transcriptional activator
VPAQHPLAKLERVPLPLLADLPLIQFSRTYSPSAHDWMNATAEQAGVTFRTLFETEHLLTTLNAVGSGLGFSLLAEYVEEVLPKTVVARPLALDPEPRVELLVAYRKDDRLPALAFFLSLLRDFERTVDSPVGAPLDASGAAAAVVAD